MRTEEQTNADGASGWPMVPGDTALIVRVPEADFLMQGELSAHVTVLIPFLPVQRIDGAVQEQLIDLLRSHDSFDLTFARIGRHPGLLYLDPQPHAPLRALTRELTRRWPGVVPYWGIFGAGLAPHLTIARWDEPTAPDADPDALESRLTSALPVHTHVRQVALTVWNGTRWLDHQRYPLA